MATFHLFITLLSFLLSATTTLAIPRPLNTPAPPSLIAVTAGSVFQRLTKRAVGGVKLCTGTHYTGSCDYVVWPLNVCINLNDYAGHTLSFLPDEGNECYLMQDRCNAEELYADLYNNSTDAADLTQYTWIGHSQSYICLTPLSL